jgi:DNA (cytosine-5)-methyltransferase 1
VLGSLAALGYDAEWHCIPACAVGAPHRRDRVWVVAYASCTGRRSRGQSSSTRKEIAHRSIEKAHSEGARLEGARDVTGADRCGQGKHLTCNHWNSI